MVFILVSSALTPVGAVSIYDIQYTENPSGDSPYAGQTVTFQGFVSAIFYDGYVVAEEEAPWCAVYVYSNRDGPGIGDEVRVTGLVTEYNGMTEITTVSDFQVLSYGNILNPVILDAQSARQEKYESVLVTVLDCTVDALSSYYNEWTISDGSDDLICNDKNDYLYFPKMGDYLNSVTGIVFYSYGDFRLEPRFTLDIDGEMIPHYVLKGDIVTMNSSRDVIPGGYIEILGDTIVSIGTQQPPGLDLVDVGGLIFPGLIDSHNHPRYNILGEIPFPCTFTERYEWQNDPMYDDFYSQYYDILDYGGDDAQSDTIWKIAEARALCAGTTMIQGYNCNTASAITIAHSGMGINNAERFPSRIHSNTFPLRDQSDYNRMRNEYWDRFVIHLCEGFSNGALQEFYTWQSWGMLDWRTTIIHGVPLTETEYDIMAAENAHLIWSPFSNIVLYDVTADVPTALAAGVNVALAPDWTESGQDDMLSEIKFANQINQERFGGIISPLQFAEFVTCNAACALGQQDRVGSIASGYQADLMVIPGNPSAPYDSLLESSAGDVLLTVVNGRPMYGDPALMDQFPFVERQEDIYICSIPKRIAIRVDTHGIPDSDRSIHDVLTTLQTAYNLSFPKLCEFVHYDPCGGSGATPTPPLPTATPTSGPCDELGVTIWMPSNDFGPGDPCALEARICNPSSIIYLRVPLFVILDIYGSHYFAPSFSDYDHYVIDELDTGIHTETVLPQFLWPEGAGSASGILVYGAMTDRNITQLFGEYSIFTFGWHQ